MTARGVARTGPGRLQRLAFRLPLLLYRFRLGALLGSRVLLLEHTGRRTGVTRRTVLEVVEHDPAGAGSYLVASGFGDAADWYRNLLAGPAATVTVGSRRLAVTAHPLAPAEAGAAMVRYAGRHPRAARQLSRFLGHRIDGGEAGYRAVGEAMPFVRLLVRPPD